MSEQQQQNSQDQQQQQQQRREMQDQGGLCVISVKPSWQSKSSQKVSMKIGTEAIMTIQNETQTGVGSEGGNKGVMGFGGFGQSQGTNDEEESLEDRQKAVGTDHLLEQNVVPGAQPAGTGYVYPGEHYDEQEVADFLGSIQNSLTEELKQLSKSTAFENYEPGWKEKSKVGAKLVATFPSVVYLDSSFTSSESNNKNNYQNNNNQQQQGDSNNSSHQPLQVTGVSWNATGAFVAASYGRFDSYTWSTGNGFVAVWPATGSAIMSSQAKQNEGNSSNDNKSSSNKENEKKKSRKSSTSSPTAVAGGGGQQDNNLNANPATPGGLVERPLILLETDAFATCVAFHPVVPQLVAAATFSGEILLYDISQMDDSTGASVKPICSNFGGVDKHHHASSASRQQHESSSSKAQDPINKLVWVENLRETREAHKYLLCSGSADGAVSFWTPSNRFTEPVGNGTCTNRRRAALGVQSIAFMSTAGASRRVPLQEAPMVMGADSGDVVKGKVPPARLHQAAAAKQHQQGKQSQQQQQQQVSLNDTEYYEQHSGPTNSVDASPFFRNIFLSCSSDGSIRLYSLLDMQHKLALVPSPDTKHFLYSASFSPIRPGVIATCSRSSQVHIYDLTHSRVKPSFTVDHAGIEDSAVLCLGWNSTGSSFATGDAKGCVRVWSVNSSLCETTELERLAIRFADRATAQKGGSGASLDAEGNFSPSKSMNIAMSGSTLEVAGDSVGESKHPIQMLYGFIP